MTIYLFKARKLCSSDHLWVALVVAVISVFPVDYTFLIWKFSAKLILLDAFLFYGLHDLSWRCLPLRKELFIVCLWPRVVVFIQNIWRVCVVITVRPIFAIRTMNCIWLFPYAKHEGIILESMCSSLSQGELETLIARRDSLVYGSLKHYQLRGT